MTRVASAARGIDAARAALRISGAGHSAAIHSNDPTTILRFGAQLPVGLVSVNVGASLGCSVIETAVPPTMTIGPGRNREASMLLPGRTLIVHELTPALYAAVAANEAERAAPGITVVDVSMIGAAGRVYLAGSPPDVRLAAYDISTALEVEGKDA